MSKPLFSTAWAAAMEIYDPVNTGQKVADTIGGKVALNINNPNPQQAWNNTCAVRMSYVLNESGTRIPYIEAETVSGADKRWYFFRIRNMITFLKKRWGAPEVLAYPPAGGGPLAGRKGLILFEVSGWSDATGHATLFDGRTCYDKCYFNTPNATYRTDRANFWSLP